MSTRPDVALPAANDPIVAKAIEWIVTLRSGERDPSVQQAFQRWCADDVRHAAAVARLEQALGKLRELPAGTQATAKRALLAAPPRRKLLRNALGLAALGLGSAAVTQRYTPLETLTADLRTGTGERRRFMLADGSELWLNARSAVDIEFDAQVRRIHVRSGEIVVTVAHDASRPFVVKTEHGSAQALGTRYLVRKEDDDTVLAVLHSSVRVTTQSGEAASFNAGQGARFNAQGITVMSLAPVDASAWTDGFIEIHDRPLSELITALKPYRAGLLRCSRAAGKVRITGTFSLDDSNRTLAALAETLPVAVQRRTDYWVSIDLR